MKFYKILFLFSLAISQEIPNEFSEFHKRKILTELGMDWSQNSIFGPIRWIQNDRYSDSLLIQNRFGFEALTDNSKLIYGYGHFTYNKFFHGYLYSRIVNNPDLFQRYSGIARDIARSGFTSGETDLSGICYENNWLILQFGRGRQSWGAGNDIQLGISEESNPYDYGMIDLDFGKLRVRYFNGYLETDSLSISRFITGRGIEWNNQENSVLGLSEVVVYSGKNRTVDFAYFNPISTHLEIELNDKQNNLGTDSGNAIWQFSLDHLLLKNIKISFNYLFDEFVLDKVQKDKNKISSGAYSLKFVYIPKLSNISSFTTFYGSIIKVGTNTFRHEDGNNNFVNRGSPLGWIGGSDAREYKLGINSFINDKRIMMKLSIGKKDIGENTINENTYYKYTNFVEDKFPSGKINTKVFANGEFHWWVKPYLTFIFDYDYNIIDKHNKLTNLNFGINIFYPINAKI